MARQRPQSLAQFLPPGQHRQAALVAQHHCGQAAEVGDFRMILQLGGRAQCRPGRWGLISRFHAVGVSPR